MIRSINLVLQQPYNGNIYYIEPISGELNGEDSKHCINNPLQIINQHESSGGVDTPLLKGDTVRLSISPSQGDDPGFKSRPEHLWFLCLNPRWGVISEWFEVDCFSFTVYSF